MLLLPGEQSVETCPESCFVGREAAGCTFLVTSSRDYLLIQSIPRDYRSGGGDLLYSQSFTPVASNMQVFLPTPPNSETPTWCPTI